MKSLPQGERTEEGPAGTRSRRTREAARTESPAVTAAQIFKTNRSFGLSLPAQLHQNASRRGWALVGEGDVSEEQARTVISGPVLVEKLRHGSRGPSPTPTAALLRPALRNRCHTARRGPRRRPTVNADLPRNIGINCSAKEQSLSTLTGTHPITFLRRWNL